MAGMGPFFSSGTGFSGSTDGTGSGALFSIPLGIAVDNNGNIYVADSGNNTIRKGWPAATQPAIVLGAPALANNQVQFSFTLTTGSASSFKLFQANQIGGPWTINTGAVVTT